MTSSGTLAVVAISAISVYPLSWLVESSGTGVQLVRHEQLAFIVSCGGWLILLELLRKSETSPRWPLLLAVAVSARAILFFSPPSDDIYRYVWEGRVTLAGANPGNVRITGPGFTAALQLDGQARPFNQTFTLPPGQHTVQFRCDAPAGHTPTDKRELVFRLNNFKLTELE